MAERQRRELTAAELARIEKAYRACGAVVCEICNKTFAEHPLYEPSRYVNGMEDAPYLNELCDGSLVKL